MPKTTKPYIIQGQKICNKWTKMELLLYTLMPFLMIYYFVVINPVVAGGIMAIFILAMIAKNNFLKIFGTFWFFFTVLLLDSENSLVVGSVAAWASLMVVSAAAIFYNKSMALLRNNKFRTTLLIAPLFLIVYIFQYSKFPTSPLSVLAMHTWAIVIIFYGILRMLQHLYAQNTRCSWLASAFIIFSTLPLFYGVIVDAHYQKTSLYGHWKHDTHPAHQGPKEPNLYDAQIPGIIPIGRIHDGKNQIFYVPPAHPFLKTYAVIRIPYNPDSQNLIRMYERTLVFPFVGGLIIIRNSDCKKVVLHATPSCWLPSGTHTITSTHYLRLTNGHPYDPLTGYMVERTDTITVDPAPAAP